MNYKDIKEAWNKQADQFNQWDVLCSEEMVEFAMLIEREECAKIAQETICDTHIPTGINIYGTRAAKAIRSKA